MTKHLDRYTGWVTQIAQRIDFAPLARALGHLERKRDCLVRRQGLCPGLVLCHDCPWAEA